MLKPRSPKATTEAPKGAELFTEKYVKKMFKTFFKNYIAASCGITRQANSDSVYFKSIQTGTHSPIIKPKRSFKV